MEADILRLILFVIGVAVIFGIYAFDRFKRGGQNDLHRDWMDDQPRKGRSEHIEPSWDKIYESVENPRMEEQVEGDAEADGEPLYGISDEPYPLPQSQQDEEDADDIPESVDETVKVELDQLEDIIQEEHRHIPEPRSRFEHFMPKEQISISFLTREFRKDRSQEKEIDLPTKIIQLNIVPHENLFYGDDVMSMAHEVGLEPGDMDIFHRFEVDAEQQHALYSMANMVEPGTFPMDDMDNFSTPGLTLFSQLPGPKDGLSIFADMLHAAEQLANKLGGELRDGAHSALTKQTIGHMREEIQEHHRQVQLARSKR